MKENYYIASCIFTAWHTELSEKIQEYVKKRFGMTIVRCCMPNFKVEEYAGEMPECYQNKWLSMPNTLDFSNVDTICTVCHNCANLIKDTHPDIKCNSLMELILSDENFEYPDYKHKKMYVQDCWRSAGNRAEQEAVRTLLNKMNIDIIELSGNFDRTEFCGRSFYKIKHIRDSRLAPKNHPLITNPDAPVPSEEEQRAMMKDYCRIFKDTPVVCYCHYCLEGLKIGDADCFHIAELLFK